MIRFQWRLIVTGLFDEKPQTIIELPQSSSDWSIDDTSNFFFCLLQVVTWAEVMIFSFTILCNGLKIIFDLFISIPDLMVMCDASTLNQSCRNDGGSAEVEWSYLAGRQSPSFLDASTFQRASSELVWSASEESAFQICSFHCYIFGGVTCLNQLFIFDIFAIFFK